MSLSQIWQHHIEAWQQTQSSQAQFCRDNHLNIGQFGYWKRKLLNQNTTAVPASSKFTVAQFEAVALADNSPLSVVLPDGVRLEGIDESNAHIVVQLAQRLR